MRAGNQVLEGRGVQVAVIDSGVHATHPHIGRVAGGIAIALDLTTSVDYVDRLGHGTAVMAAIREKAVQADLFAVKVFDRSLSTDVAVLIAALDWATDRGVHLVNLSLGTSVAEHAQPLQAAIDRARRRHVLVVAAGPQDGVRWLPGSLDGVVPVLLDWDCPRDRCRISTAAGRAIVHTSGFPRPIPGVPPDRNLKGLSFAVANASGLIACGLEAVGHAPLDQLPRVLDRVVL